MGVINNLPNKNSGNSSSGGALIKKYRVASGYTVNAGDVVNVNDNNEIYSTNIKTVVYDDIVVPNNNKNAEFVQINDNTIFAVYRDSTNSYTCYCIVKYIDGNWTVTYTNNLITSGTGENYEKTIVKMNDYRFFVTEHDTDNEPTGDLYFIQFNNDYSSSTIASIANSMSNDRVVEVYESLNESTLLQLGGYYNGNNGYVAVYTFDGTTITKAVAPKSVSSFSCGDDRTIIKTAENKVIVLSEGGNSSVSSIFGMTWDGSTLTTNKLFSNSTSSVPYVIYQNDNIILVCHSYAGSSSDAIYKISNITADIPTFEKVVTTNYESPLRSNSSTTMYLTSQNNTSLFIKDNNIYEYSVDLSTYAFNLVNTYTFTHFKSTEITSLEKVESGIKIFVNNKNFYDLKYNLPVTDNVVLYNLIVSSSSECIALESGNENAEINCIYSGSAELPVMKKGDKIISSGISAYCRIPGIIEIGAENNENFVIGSSSSRNIVLGFMPKSIEILFKGTSGSNTVVTTFISNRQFSSYTCKSSGDSYPTHNSCKITYNTDGVSVPYVKTSEVGTYQYKAYF